MVRGIVSAEAELMKTCSGGGGMAGTLCCRGS